MEAPIVTHRLAAILAADAAGFSRLMNTDELATVATLDAARASFREGIESHRGRVVDMAGDSVLAVFDTATGAAAAALAIQRELLAAAQGLPQQRRLPFRIGLHLGDVLEKADGTIYGDGVNIAARIQTLADPDGIALSESMQVAVRSRIVASFEDLGEHSVKNIAEPVHVYRIDSRMPEPEPPATSAVRGILHKPSLAVLPFTNIGGDPQQEYFSDGLTEDIITGLAAWRSFPVIARNSTFGYKGQSPDIRRVATELGARYVLEGSVRRAGRRVRITGQLIDGVSGSHLWAEKYDRTDDDLFEVQDEITRRIVAAIEPELSAAEIRHVIRRAPDSFTAWDLYIRGLANMPSYGRQREQTKQLFEQALAEDPSFVDAAAALAMCHSADIYASRSSDVEQSIERMFELARRGLNVDARNFRVHAAQCLAHFWRGDMDRSVAAGRQAVALNPSSTEALEGLSAALCHQGLAREAEACAQMCLQLTPVDPRLHHYHFLLAQALLGQRRFQEAYDQLMSTMSVRPHDTVLMGYRAVLLGHLERGDEARAALAAYLGRRGFAGAEDYRRQYIRNSALTELNLEGLRKAGWKV